MACVYLLIEVTQYSVTLGTGPMSEPGWEFKDDQTKGPDRLCRSITKEGA